MRSLSFRKRREMSSRTLVAINLRMVGHPEISVEK
jgi:hypothetical protein